MKNLILSIVLLLSLTLSVQAAGLSASFLTEQVANVDGTNAIAFRLGYYLGAEEGGLEPFLGTDWRPNWNEEGEMDPPSVLAFGVINHFTDLVDSENKLPLIPDFFLGFLNEDVEIRPYIGTQFSINFPRKDAGFMGGLAGIKVRVYPKDRVLWLFEARYDDVFDALSAIPDNQLNAYFGLCYPF